MIVTSLQIAAPVVQVAELSILLTIANMLAVALQVAELSKLLTIANMLAVAVGKCLPPPGH